MRSNKIECVQIGASTGLTPQQEDIIYPLTCKYKWEVLLVEPLPEQFDKLKENYKLFNNIYFENVAIMPYNGNVTIFYEQNGDLRIASANRLHNIDKNTSSISVPCITLYSLLEKYNLLNIKFKLLQIDTEGLDGEILLSTDFTYIKPKYIRFEHCHLGKNNNPSKDSVIKHLNKFKYFEIEDIYRDLSNEPKTAEGPNGSPINITMDTMMERMDYDNV